MADSSINFSIALSAVDNASSVLKSVGSALQDIASGDVIGGVTKIGTALVGIGTSALNMAGTFQQGMTSLITGAGEAQSNIKLVSDGILQMAVDTGTSTKQLTDGMYMIESAGYHGAEGLNVLKVAAEGAKVGNADLGVTANALTTMLHDYGMSSDQAASAMNGLITTVASGKTHLQDLAGSMSAVLPLASNLGVSFPQIGGAMATMTNAGMTAQHASQNLAAALRALSRPGAGATKLLQSMGLSAQQLSDILSTQGLTGALQTVEDHIGKKFPAGSQAAKNAFSTLMGGATGVQVEMMIGGKNMKTFEDNVKSVSSAMNSGSKDVTGWSLVQQNLNFQMARFQEIGETSMIRLGQALLPMVTGAFELLNNVMTGVGSVMGYIGNAMGGIDFTDFDAACIDIGRSISIAVLAIQRFAASLKPISDDVDPIADAIGTFAHFALQDLTAILWKAYEGIDLIASAMLGVRGPADSFGNIFKQVGAILGGQFKADMAWINNAFDQTGNWIQTKLLPALATLIPPFQSIATTILTNLLPAFAKIWASGMQLVEFLLTLRINSLENMIPPVIRLAGFLAGALATAFQVVAPLVGVLANVIGGLVDFFTKTEVGSALVKAALLLLVVPLGYLALAFTALAAVAIADFIASVPLMVAGFLAGAAAAWTMAAAVIALTWPILAAIAVIALIILAVQHWGDIMDWMSGKTEQTRIKVEQEHAKMRIAQDDNTAKGAQAAIDNMEKERLGIIQKLKQTNDESEKLALTHQYNMIASQEQAQKAKLQKADEDKKQQLAKQKELHDQMLEAQKPWYQRMWDAIANFFGNVGQWFADRFAEARNGITSAFAPVGGWFHDKWNEVQNWWGGVGQWFHDKWNEVASSTKSVWENIVTAVKNAWEDIVAAVKNAGKALMGAIVAVFNDLVGRFEWLYNHNYYFHDLVDNIVKSFKSGIALVRLIWTTTVNWLVGVWQGIVKIATTVWNAVSFAVIVAVFVVWCGLVSAWTTLSGWLVSAWTAIASVATTVWNAVSSAIMSAVKAVWGWLVGVWNVVSSWLVGVWTAVAKFATDLWNKIATAVHDAWVKAVGFVSSVWNQIAAFFANAWNAYIVKPLTALWTSVSNVFSSAWNTYIVKPLTDLWNSISKWWTDLGAGAQNSGKNFINMLVNGINSGVGSIWNAVVNIANTIWKALGFHSPAKAGPGADADQWMPNLVNMLSSSLNAGVPKIQAAVNAAAQPLTALSPTNNRVISNADQWVSNLVSKISSDLSSGATSIQAAVNAMIQPLMALGGGTQSAPAAAAPQSTANNTSATTIHVHLDGNASADAQKRGRDIADVVKKELAKNLRQQSVAPRYTSGGSHH